MSLFILCKSGFKHDFFFNLNYWNHWQQSVKWSKEWEKVCVCVSFEHSHWWVQSVGYHPHSITHRPDSRVVYSSLPERTKFCSVLSWGFFSWVFVKLKAQEDTHTQWAYEDEAELQWNTNQATVWSVRRRSSVSLHVHLISFHYFNLSFHSHLSLLLPFLLSLIPRLTGFNRSFCPFTISCNFTHIYLSHCVGWKKNMTCWAIVIFKGPVQGFWRMTVWGVYTGGVWFIRVMTSDRKHGETCGNRIHLL